MNSVVAILLVGLAVAYGQTTNGQVKSCFQTAHTTCRSQCLSTIADPNVQSKVSSCFTQGDAQRAQFEATMTTCLNTAVPGFESQPCFKKPDNFGGKGDHGGRGGFGSSQVNPVMSAFHNCSRSCMQNQMTTCTAGCTGTITTAIQSAFRTCKPQRPQFGQQGTTGTFDMRACMKAAVGTV